MNIVDFMNLSDDEKRNRVLTIPEDSEFLKDKVFVVSVTEEDLNDHNVTTYIYGVYEKYRDAYETVKNIFRNAKHPNWYTNNIFEETYDIEEENLFDEPSIVSMYRCIQIHTAKYNVIKKEKLNDQ